KIDVTSYLFFFSSRRRHTRSKRDWSSDVCSSDLVSQALDSPIIIADRFHFCRYIYWALDRARINVQKEFHDYDRKKCKRMRHVFYRPYEELSDNQNWYLKRYLGMSNYLKRAYQ